MEELGMIEKIATPAPVFIPYFDKDRLHDYLRLAAALRAAGIGVEVFRDPKKLGQQLKYADRRGFRVALIAGGDEFQPAVCQVKNLQTGENRDVPLGRRCDASAVRRIGENNPVESLLKKVSNTSIWPDAIEGHDFSLENRARSTSWPISA